ncbi:MAG: hypothetical protein WCE96_06795 [Nitrososphaeraceae archaeon]
MSNEQLRIRPDNATILNIPKEKLEVLQKVVSSPQTTDEVKKIMIKKFAEVSPCCICGGIPLLIIRIYYSSIPRFCLTAPEKM